MPPIIGRTSGDRDAGRQPGAGSHAPAFAVSLEKMAGSLLAPHRRIDGRARRVGLLLAAGLGLILSALDPWPAAQSPWHDHLVIGAHGLREWARALVSHRHESLVWLAHAQIDIQPPRARPVAAVPGAPRVLSINPRADGAGLAIFDLGALLLADAEARMRLTVPRWGESAHSAGVRLQSPVSVPVPLHPPRTSA